MAVVAASTDTGLWQWDVIRQRLWTTEHCRTMFGVAFAQTATPDVFLNAVHSEDLARVRAALGQILTTPDLEEVEEFRIARPGGEFRWFVVRTHTELDRKGNPVRVSGVFRDVTQRVRAQQEARMLSQRLQAWQEEERRSIAQEVLEATSQDLVAVGLGLSVLGDQISPAGATHRNTIDGIVQSVYQTIGELGTFAFLIRPTRLGGDDLCAVLERYVDGFGRRTGLKTKLRSSPAADRMPLDAQRAVLRIVQESLTNVHHHAGATQATIQLRCIANRLHLIIADDGEGMAPPIEGEKVVGLGIPRMTARVAQLGGRVAIRSCSKGTLVHAVIPLAVAVSSEFPSVEAGDIEPTSPEMAVGR